MFIIILKKKPQPDDDHGGDCDGSCDYDCGDALTHRFDIYL